ncbi:hypothetical protein [Mesomycoplasma hyopneumoniae]|uniref:Uncharacterized protein n=1 Tax=Mesomycoplasma hyopneumoniae TaxID=2099 RepID=A0ABD4SWC1_MESHO|nr:hypothetical protein [Mesomycoplasma hyopneumoniae]MCI8283395.1 hypothetical protein [Mesomycoplasma hyopneumoniae]MCI8298326.1 hypothetical protein [Mesomycoplasma hyopneumoniae]
MRNEKQLDFSYDSAQKNPYFAKWIQNLSITKEEFIENLDLFWLAIQFLSKPNYKYEIVRNLFTGRLVSKTTFIYNENFVQKKWLDYFLLPEISFKNAEKFAKYVKENYPKSKKILPLKQYKNSFKKMITAHKLIYLKGGDSIQRSELLKSFAIIFAKNSNNVGFFSLSEISHYIYENKLNLLDKLRNVKILLIEFDLVNNFTKWFIVELANILIDRIMNKKITFLGFDDNFYGNNKDSEKKIIGVIKNYGFSDPIWAKAQKIN